MRVKLKEGKQEELVNFAKEGKTWGELSVQLSLVAGYIRNELRKEKTLLSEETYKKLCGITGKDYGRDVVERLDDNWGRAKGGKNSSDSLVKKIKVPKDSVELAEFYGIMLGDGHLSKIKAYKIGTYEARIVGHAVDDKDYLVNYVKSLTENLFELEVRVSKHKYAKALVLAAKGKRLVEFLESKGFKPGNKIKNRLVIPKWIKDNKKFLKACLRGLYDTDGGIYKLNNQNTFQIVFTNYNRDLLDDVRNGLLYLGISPSNIVNGKRVYITKKSELRKFLKLIGFSNFKHLNKIKMWNLSPIV